MSPRHMGWQAGSDGDAAPRPTSRESDRNAFRKRVGFWVPKRFVSKDGIDVDATLADINHKIEQRGFVLYDGQILTTPVNPANGIEEAFDALAPEDADYPMPPRRPWRSAQRDYFGLDDPYQMADEGDRFTWSSICCDVAESYLYPEEMISGLLHGELDDSYFTCPCHYATVVYTTRHRFVCMTCGATHVVLEDALPATVRQLLTAPDWRDYFDDDGMRHHEVVDLATIEFRDIEQARVIWQTDQWEEASREFVFFARSSSEEIAEAIRGTELDPSIFLEDGWTPIAQAPPPAFQLMHDSIDVSLLENAQHAFEAGVAGFVAAYVDPAALLQAIPSLFRAVELILKARLETICADDLASQPNNPTVLSRLRNHGVSLAAGEEQAVVALRRLRNRLQHGTATFNHRSGLATCRTVVIFVDRFVDEEFDAWTGDAVSGPEWDALLQIPEIASRAQRVASARLEPYRIDPAASITVCNQCSQLMMLRPHNAAGASCVYCGRVPIND